MNFQYYCLLRYLLCIVPTALTSDANVYNIGKLHNMHIILEAVFSYLLFLLVEMYCVKKIRLVSLVCLRANGRLICFANHTTKNERKKNDENGEE